MGINIKRIFLVVMISIVLVVMFVFLNFTVSKIIVKGEENVSSVKETDTEFELENTATLRNKPDFSSKVIGTIKKDTHVQVLRKLNNWIKITDGANEGWVIMQNVVTVEMTNIVDNSENNTINNQTDITNETVENNIRNEAVLNNTSDEIVANIVENKVTSSNSSNTTSNITSTSNVGKTGIINVDTAKVREKPDGKMVGLVDLNDKVEILSEEGDWYKVNVDKYKGCYIAKRLVTIK